MPKRVVITNGEWLILFRNPKDSFLQAENIQSNNVLVYSNLEEIKEKYREIYGFLEYQKVLNEAPPLTIGEIAFYVAPDEALQILHGIKLKYSEEPEFYYERTPVIKVLPILYLRTQFDTWLLVESNNPCKMPFEMENLADHLNEVQQIASNLLSKLNTNLNTNLIPTTIESYFEDTVSFEILHCVTAHRIQSHPEHDEYLIITGQYTHYFKLIPTVLNCPHHTWALSKQKNVASLVSIQSRSVEPRSFFKDNEIHHCNHLEVENAKSSQITSQNSDRCGLRSGSNYDAFCEIWKFETRLCCRTCVFENVCTKTQVFNLPCE